MLPLDNFIDLIKVKKEISDNDDDSEDLINFSVFTNHQTDYLMNIKFESANVQSLHNNDPESLSGRFPSDNFINSINIKKEIFDTDDECENHISSPILANQTKYQINMKIEPDSVESLHNNDTETETFTLKGSIGVNTTQFSTPIIKHDESIDIKSEVPNILDSTSVTADLQTSSISIKDESYGKLEDFESYPLYENSRELDKNNCHICGKIFSSRQNLKRHCKEVHSNIKKYICHLCNKGFFHKYILIKHIRTVHDKIRDWNCKKCGKSFAEKINLNRHESMVHLKIRDWKCAHCDKCFTTNNYLKKHERTIHLRIRDWKCAHCEKSYGTKQQLKYHERMTHLRIRDWKCTHCDKSFISKRDLEYHEREIHLKIRNWKCTKCEKFFARKFELKCHDNTVHLKIRDWKCTKCEKSFAKKHSLNLHENMVHLKNSKLEVFTL